MAEIAFEIVFVVFLTVLNGVFSMSELAIVSARKVLLQQSARKGNRGAQAALDLAGEPNAFLSTVQIGITLIGILAGAVGGGGIAQYIELQLKELPVVGRYAQTIGVGIVVLIITYLSLVIGELIPKRLALGNAEGISTFMSRPMKTLAFVTSPVVWLLSFSTDFILRLFGVGEHSEKPITEEEIRVLIHQGAQAGMLEHAEREMVEGVFKLGDRKVGALMTSRKEIAWLDLEDSHEELRKKIVEYRYSRFPVAHGSLDRIAGIVQAKDLLDRLLQGFSFDLKEVLQHALFVPENMPALKMLETFKRSGRHLAFVVDEYGVVQGMVTLHDILEAIVGDLPMVEDLEEEQAIRREDGSWLLDGMLSVDKLKQILQLEHLPEEEKDAFQTLGGFVFARLGHIPKTGERFEWMGHRFEVIDMDKHRVDKVLLQPASNS